MIRFMLENDTGRFAVFNGNGPEVPSWNSYLERFNAALGFPPLAPPDPSLGLKVALRRPVRKVGKYLLANHRDLLVAVAARSSKIKSAMKKAEEDLRLRPNDDEMDALRDGCHLFHGSRGKDRLRAADQRRRWYRHDRRLGARHRSCRLTAWQTAVFPADRSVDAGRQQMP